MPLLRRNSSKDRKQSASSERRTDESGVNSSIFERIARRRSSASDNNTQPSHDVAQPSNPVKPPASSTPPIDSQQSTIGAQRPRSRSHSHSHSHSHSESRQRSSSRSVPPIGQDDLSSSINKPLPHLEPEHVQGGLTKDDVQHLFSGAPHFMLEKGRRGRYFPQAYFPWNNQLDITDLQDRPYIKHESFALATMHAHLPVPDEVNWKPGMPHPKPVSTNISGTSRRPIFDLGIYERPNMMGITGTEIGTMGFRAYLERPVADGLNQATHDGREHSHDVDAHDTGTAGSLKSPGGELNLEHMSASEAFKALAHEGGEAKIGKHAPYQDRNDLMKGGTRAWKTVGMRYVGMDVIAERLCLFSKLRDEFLTMEWRHTILNVMTEAQMGDFLFGELLYPPSKIVDGKSETRDLKVQIEALVKVLTTPGVWLDFSQPAQRILWVHSLYATRREDQQFPNDHGILSGESRRWNLIQLVLAIELVLRLDAALKLGVASHQIDLTPQEIHHFNKLRNLKVDWDLVIARRFLDLCYAKKIPLSPATTTGTSDHPGQPNVAPQSPRKEHRGFLDKFTHSLSFTGKEPEEPQYTLAILPRQPRMMGEGLIRFGTDIKWPTIEAVRQSLVTKLAVAHDQMEEMLARGIEPAQHERVAAHDYDHCCLELRAASEHTVGGPLSHGWLGGLILPGGMTPSLLMCTLLENDPEGNPLKTLGNKAWTREGFVWRGRSWWSKLNIAGLVMAPSEGTVERIGWVALPAEATPINATTGEVFPDGWLLVKTLEPKQTRQGHRIQDGEALSKESSPLGIGHGKVSSTEFNMVTDHILDGLRRPNIEKVQLVMEKSEDKHSSLEDKEQYAAAVAADFVESGTDKTKKPPLIIPLRYNARFVAGYPCRPPHGHVTAPHAGADGDGNADGEPHHTKPVHKHLEHLPAHPLHKSFKFVAKSVDELLQLDAADWLPDPHDREAGSVWIIDATGETAAGERGDRDLEAENVPAPKPGLGGQGGMREILVRAWCAKVGRDAVVSRVGRQCLGCAVREARALEVAVVIRVGEVLGV